MPRAAVFPTSQTRFAGGPLPCAARLSPALPHPLGRAMAAPRALSATNSPTPAHEVPCRRCADRHAKPKNPRPTPTDETATRAKPPVASRSMSSRFSSRQPFPNPSVTRQPATGYSLPLPTHLSPHPEQLPHRPRRQALHLIMQLGHGIEKSRHRGDALASKLRPRLFGIELREAAAQHLARGIDFPPLPLFHYQAEHLPD